MASIAEQNRLKFVEQFNRVLGSKTGRPMSFTSDAAMRAMVDDKYETEAALHLAKKLKVARKTKPAKAAKETPGPTSATDILAMLGKAPKGGGVTPSTGKDFKLELGKLKSGIDEGGVSGLWHDITTNPVSHFIANNPVTSAVGKGLQVPLERLARIAYTSTGALSRAAEAESPTRILPEFFHGAVAGATGKSKVGFGEITDKPPVVLQALDKTAETNPHLYDNPKLVKLHEKLEASWKDKTGFEQWSHRGIGLAGDILTDPTTYFTGGVATIEKGVAKQGSRTVAKEVAKGTLAVGKDALKNRAATIVKSALDEHNIRDIKKVRKGSTQTKSLSDHIIQQVHKKVDDTVFDMRKGGMIGGPESVGTIAGTISEGVRDSFVDIIRRPSEKYTASIRLGKEFDDEARAALKASNPLFGQWLDIAEDLAKKGKHSVDEIHDAATAEFIRQLEPKIGAIRATVTGQLEDAVLKVPTVQFMGKKIYLPKTGRALQKVGQRAGSNPYLANASKAMRYSSWFPGYTTHISQKLKAMNVQRYNDFKDEIEVLLTDTTTAQRRNIHRAIQEGIDLPGVDGDIQQGIKQHYKDMWEEEIKHGARTEGETPFANNYVYNTIGGGRKLDPKFDDNWRNPKKQQVKLNNNIDGFTSEDAIKKGWKVEEDVGQALMNRKAKSIRELSRVNFKKDLVHHYGIRSSIDPKFAKQANLNVLDQHRYKEIYNDSGLKLAPGEKLYLDKDIEKIYDNYNDLVSYSGSSRGGAIALGLDKVNKLFKTANTIYWPGFHIRNAISDVFMGMLDGVPAHRYDQVMRAMTHKDTAALRVGTEKTVFRKIYDSYLKNAASAGFFDSEMKHAFDPRDLSTMKYMNSTLKGGLTKVNTGFRNLSQHREDFGRLVHYYHALDDEMAHQLKKGVSGDAAWRNAEEAAIERVNKFKFDYNALTPNEQWIRRHGMPFYTYMRKATPVLMENILMNPKHFSRIKRLQDSLAPSEDFKASSLPGWMQDMAYSEFSSGSHIGFTDALFPTRTLHESFSFKDLPSKLNPVVQGLFEYASGKDTYSGKPVGEGLSGITDILKNKMRAVSTFRSIESDTKPTLDKWAGFFGIPLVQVTPGRQGQRLRELEDEVVQRSTDLNKKLDDMGLKARVTKGRIELIQPKSPTADEIAHNMKPRYPPSEKDKVIGTYSSFVEIENMF